jgi:DNA-binding NarL/FixJ family response regulator
MSNKRIAAELGVSLRTIQAHLRHLFNKVGASSRTEAVVLSMKKGWLSLQDIS